MKRFHVHLNVRDLEASIGFYSRLFGVAPNVRKDDYAKWLLDDPRLNFAISARARAPGLDHLGLQVEDAADLADIGARLAETVRLAERDTTCCYARSDKYWSEDPQGIRWESFHTRGDATTYYAVAAGSAPDAGAATACCGPSGSAGGRSGAS